MNALSLYLTTTRMVFQPNLDVDDSASWADINRLLVYLRQALTCCVCGCLLQVPMSSTISQCQHHVCKTCMGGKMRLKPSCSFCKDQSKFVENTQLRILLQSYKDLCDYIVVSDAVEKWGHLPASVTSTSTKDVRCSDNSAAQKSQFSASSSVSNGCTTNNSISGPSTLSELIEEGLNYTDKYKFSEPPPLIQTSQVKSNTPSKIKSLPSPVKVPKIATENVVKEPIETPAAVSIDPVVETNPEDATANAAKPDVPAVFNVSSTPSHAETDLKSLRPAEKKARMSRTVIPQAVTANVPMKTTPEVDGDQGQTPSAVARIPNVDPIPTPVVPVVQAAPAPAISSQLVPPIASKEVSKDDDLKKKIITSFATSSASSSGSFFSSSASSSSGSSASSSASMVPMTVTQQQTLIKLAANNPTNVSNFVTNPVVSTVSITPSVPMTVTQQQQLQMVIPTSLAAVKVNQPPTAPTTLTLASPLTPTTGSNNPPPPLSPTSKNKSKRRGCRCGLATPTPGKLTCCGQRCPCYVDSKGCFDCKCRGCRNPHHANTTPGICVAPAVKPAPGTLTAAGASIKAILTGEKEPKAINADGKCPKDPKPAPANYSTITTIGSCQLVPIPSTSQIVVTSHGQNKGMMASGVQTPTFSFFPMNQTTSAPTILRTNNIVITSQPMIVNTSSTPTSLMSTSSALSPASESVPSSLMYHDHDPLSLPLTMDDLTIGSNDDDPTKMTENPDLIFD